MPEGQGTTTWSNGSRYEGSYSGGKRSGQGTYTWTNGRYVGEWRDGRRFNGRDTTADGKVTIFVEGSIGGSEAMPSSQQSVTTLAQAAADRVSNSYDQRIASASVGPISAA